MRPILAILLALSMSACATGQKLGAANDVHALLVAIRDNDAAAFERHVDRPSLSREIEARVVREAVGRDRRLGGLAAVLAPGLADLAGETLIQPGVFRFVAAQYGYGADARIPAPMLIARQLKALPDGRVCATRAADGPCLLMFTKIDGTWKLSGFEGQLSELRL